MASDGAGERTSIWAVLDRYFVWQVVNKVRLDGVTNLAGALTYYSVLSLVPTFLVFVVLLALFGEYPATSDALLEAVGQVAPEQVVETLRGPIEGVVQARTGVNAVVGLAGLAIALWSGATYVGTYIWAANIIHGVQGQIFYKRLPRQLAIAVATVALLAGASTVIVLSGPVAAWFGDLIGVGDMAVTVWGYLKWVAFYVLAVLLFALLYRFGPNVRGLRLRWVSVGGAVGVTIWLIASLLFALYVANFGHYNRTYGTLATFVVFLLWMWVFNLSLLVGDIINALLQQRHPRRAEDGDGATA